MNALNGGSTKRSADTCATLQRRSNSSGNASSQRSQRRRRRPERPWSRAPARPHHALHCAISIPIFSRRPSHGRAHYPPMPRADRTSTMMTDQHARNPAPHGDDRRPADPIPDRRRRRARRTRAPARHLAPDPRPRRVPARPPPNCSAKPPPPRRCSPATPRSTAACRVQLRGHGALRTLFAECTAAGTLRGIAQFAEEAKSSARPDATSGPDAVLAITIENPLRRRPRAHRATRAWSRWSRTPCGAFEDYFRQSEQLPTRLLLAADERQRRGPDAAEAAGRSMATPTAGRAPAPCSTPSARRNCWNWTAGRPC